MDPKVDFYSQFQTKSAYLRQQISQLPDISIVGGQRQDAINDILGGISRLSQDVIDAADTVPAYDQRGYLATVKELKEQLEETTTRLAPKKARFQFKSKPAQVQDGSPSSSSSTAKTNTQNDADARRYIPSADYLGGDYKNETGSTLQVNENKQTTTKQRDYNAEIRQETSTTYPLVRRSPSFSSSHPVCLTNHQNKHIIVQSTAKEATSSGGGTLTDIQSCVIDMSIPTAIKPFANLVMRDIVGSVVVAGHVEGSVHITGVKDSVVVVFARQVRIHECEGVDFYLWCASHPIIEDCRGLRFATCPVGYATERDTPEKNQWDQVDDFKWLRSEPSPNWCVLSEEKRLDGDVWEAVSRGLDGQTLDDVLKMAGVQK